MRPGFTILCAVVCGRFARLSRGVLHGGRAADLNSYVHCPLYNIYMAHNLYVYTCARQRTAHQEKLLYFYHCTNIKVLYMFFVVFCALGWANARDDDIDNEFGYLKFSFFFSK